MAFLLSAFPSGAKYAGQYWGDFTKYLINGPVLAFFIWLSLITVQNFNAEEMKMLMGKCTSDIMCLPNFITFIIAIGFLVGGLIVSQQIGGMGASWGASTVRGLGKRAGGLAWKGTKGVGKAVSYVPAQYAKRAGYGAADKLLEVGKEIPIISGLAMKKQAELRMKREYAEEKDTRYMKYLSEQDLDRVIQNYSGKGRTRAGRALSWATRGQEASRQSYKRAWTEKMQKGDEWGMTIPKKKRNKTRALIELAELADHSVTASGEDTFRDAELGKLWHEFRNKNAGMIDDDEMRAYYLGGAGTSGREYKGLAGGDNSEYWRGPDPVTGEAGSPNSMVAYTANRMRMPQVFDLHHENLAIDPTTGTNAVLDAIYDSGHGTMRTLAQIRDRGTREQKVNLFAWMKHRQKLKDPGFTHHQKTSVALTDDDLRSNSDNTIIGRSRNVTGKSKSPEVASGITGLDNIEKGIDKGRVTLNFSDLGLDNLDALYVDGKDKTEIAGRIKNSLSKIDNDLAKLVEDKINNMSYLILHNKEKSMTGQERRATHAHELLHGRIGSIFSDDELKDVWNNSMNEEDRGKARKKVKKVYNNDKMSEDAIMHEYFTEGLTNKTKWKVKDPEKKINLDDRAEKGLNDLAKSKGINIEAFTSNLHTTRPTQENVKQAMVGSVDNELKDKMGELVDAISGMSNGLNTIRDVADSMQSVEKGLYMNRMAMEKQTDVYKGVSKNLDKLANKIV